MKIKLLSIVGLLFMLIIVSCNNTDKPLSEEDGNKMEDGKKENIVPKDSAVIDAYANDKSGISINDIDPQDTSYSTRSKTLYKSVDGSAKLTVVYGYKSDNSPGIAIVQKDTEEPVKLRQTKSGGMNKMEFGDGTVQLVRDGNIVTFNDKSGSEQFEEIR